MYIPDELLTLSLGSALPMTTAMILWTQTTCSAAEAWEEAWAVLTLKSSSA